MKPRELSGSDDEEKKPDGSAKREGSPSKRRSIKDFTIHDRQLHEQQQLQETSSGSNDSSQQHLKKEENNWRDELDNDMNKLFEEDLRRRRIDFLEETIANDYPDSAIGKALRNIREKRHEENIAKERRQMDDLVYYDYEGEARRFKIEHEKINMKEMEETKNKKDDLSHQKERTEQDIKHFVDAIIEDYIKKANGNKKSKDIIYDTNSIKKEFSENKLNFTERHQARNLVWENPDLSSDIQLAIHKELNQYSTLFSDKNREKQAPSRREHTKEDIEQLVNALIEDHVKKNQDQDNKESTVVTYDISNKRKEFYENKLNLKEWQQARKLILEKKNISTGIKIAAYKEITEMYSHYHHFLKENKNLSGEKSKDKKEESSE